MCKHLTTAAASSVHIKIRASGERERVEWVSVRLNLNPKWWKQLSTWLHCFSHTAAPKISITFLFFSFDLPHPSNDTHQEPTSKQTSFGAAAESQTRWSEYTRWEEEKKGIIKYKFSMTYHTVSLSLFSRASLLMLEHMLAFLSAGIAASSAWLPALLCCAGVYSQRSTSSAKTHWKNHLKEFFRAKRRKKGERARWWRQWHGV